VCVFELVESAMLTGPVSTGGDSCVCLGQQYMNYPFSSLPFPSLTSLPRGSGAEPPVYVGPGCHPGNFFKI